MKRFELPAKLRGLSDEEKLTEVAKKELKARGRPRKAAAR